MQAAEIQAVVQKIQAVVLKPSKIMLTTRARDALSAKRDCNVARAEDALSCNVPSLHGSCGFSCIICQAVRDGILYVWFCYL